MGTVKFRQVPLTALAPTCAGSVYKDLQLQLRGYWGEVRDWRDGSTIVQKTHDASPSLVKEEFSGRGILIVRNPYDAVMSKFHYLYGGHHGTASDQHFLRYAER